MLWTMFMVALAYMAAGACARDFIRLLNSKTFSWSALFWGILFFAAGVYFSLVLIGQVLGENSAVTYVNSYSGVIYA